MTAAQPDDVVVTDYAVAAQRGDRAALESFIRSTQRDVWRFLAHLASPAEADDLTQETYLRALRSLPRFQQRSSARVWLLSIARRVVVDQIRRGKARPVIAQTEDWQQDAALTQPPHLPGIDDTVAFGDLLTRLDADRREAFVLTQVLRMTYGEAADVCGCPVGTIRSRVARARDDLICMLSDHC